MCSPVISILIALFVLIGIGFLGKGSKSNMGWYATLKKSALTPPNWIFSAVWPLLYSMIIASFVIFWTRGCSHPAFYTILAVFAINIAANALWPLLFFKLHYITLALLDCAITALSAYILIGLLWNASFTLSAYLLVPYALWVTFATYLNFQIHP